MALDFLRQLGASAGRRAGYRLRRCPVRLPRWGLPAGMGRPVGGSMGRAASPMDGMAGPDGGLFDRGLPSVGRGGGNLLTPAFAFTRENTPGRPPFVPEPDGRGRRSSGCERALGSTATCARRWSGPTTRRGRLPDGHPHHHGTCAAIRLALRDQDLRLAQVADNLLCGITLSGHDDPGLLPSSPPRSGRVKTYPRTSTAKRSTPRRTPSARPTFC